MVVMVEGEDQRSSHQPGEPKAVIQEYLRTPGILLGIMPKGDLPPGVMPLGQGHIDFDGTGRWRVVEEGEQLGSATGRTQIFAEIYTKRQ
eukprot:11750968-Karenia_brevis.AAC.1